MKRTLKILIAATMLAGLGATTIAATGFAQHRGDADYRHGRYVDGSQWHGRHGKGRHHGRRMFRLMEKFDTNADRRLTQAEIDEVRAARLNEFDQDRDGVLTLVEYEALWLDAMRERMVDRFQDHDADGDGKVTREEFGRRFARIITRMDRNDDGVLDKSDMRRGHSRRGGGPRNRDAGEQ